MIDFQKTITHDDIPDSVERKPTARAWVATLVGIRVMGRGTFG